MGDVPTRTDILIAGGGLAGLYLAYQLEQAGMDYLIVEARNRLGGRVLSVPASDNDSQTDQYDLGPAWFWPGQPRLLNLMNELGLSVFPQYSDGNLVFQDPGGLIQRDLQYSTMAGSLRVSGGFGCLIERLSRRIPTSKILSGQKVSKLSLSRHGVRTTIQSDNREAEIGSSTVALALPPRLAAQSIEFEPALGKDAINVMRSTPTWMAAHAKVVAVYDAPFWRDAGLSGDGISQCGPLVEIHDASPATSTSGALFGFVGIPAPIRKSGNYDLAHLAIEQLAAMYGSKAAQPTSVLVQDWAREAFTAAKNDENEQLQQHPEYGTPASLAHLWAGKLHLASTEMAPTFGGYLEGALESAETVATKITRNLRSEN